MTSSAPKNERSYTPRSIALWTIPKRDEAWTLGSTSSSIEPVVKLVLLDEAQQRFEEEDAWWREHRDAKELLVEEFAEILEQVITMPETGRRYRRARGKLI